MHYPITFRRKVLAHIKEGMSKRDAARLFKISPQTLYNWLNREDLEPSLSKHRHRKIDKDRLRAHVKEHPQMLLRERAAIFGKRQYEKSAIMKLLFLIVTLEHK
jgi:transposase